MSSNRALRCSVTIGRRPTRPLALLGVFVAWAGACISREPPTSAPAATSWNGIGLRRVQGCEACCGLEFPPRFGEGGGDELQLLREIASGQGRARVLGCTVPYREVAFGHLRRLAVERQVKAAAEIVLRADTEGGIELGGGELSEVFGFRYLAPVVGGYDGLQALLDPGLEEHVAVSVCSSAMGMVANDLDVDRLARIVRSKGLTSLADRVARTCEETRRQRTVK